MEPIASAFGYTPAEPEFLEGIREVTRELGILLILDEVQSLRVAPGGAQEAVRGRPRSYDDGQNNRWRHGGRRLRRPRGRDVAVRPDRWRPGGRALGHLQRQPYDRGGGRGHNDTTWTPEVYARLSGLGETLREKLRAVFAEFEVPAQVTGVASLFGIHFTSDEITDYRSMLRGDAQMKKALFTGAAQRGRAADGRLHRGP